MVVAKHVLVHREESKRSFFLDVSRASVFNTRNTVWDLVKVFSAVPENGTIRVKMKGQTKSGKTWIFFRWVRIGGCVPGAFASTPVGSFRVMSFPYLVWVLSGLSRRGSPDVTGRYRWRRVFKLQVTYRAGSDWRWLRRRPWPPHAP